MCVCDFRDDRVVPWEVPELHGKIKVQLLMRNQFKGHSRKWSYRSRTEVEETYRTPAYMAYYLRMAISDNKNYLTTPCSAQSMTRFNGLIDQLMQGYQGQIRLVGLGFAPFPSKFICFPIPLRCIHSF